MNHESTRLTPDPVIAGLVYLEDEVQVTRVIHAMARADPSFASSFVRIIMRRLLAEEGPRAPLADQFLREQVPDELACASEVPLEARRLGPEIRRARRAGRVDLDFQGHDFRLILELKLGSGYGDRQRERYLEAAAKASASLAVIGRQKDPASWPYDPNWLGETTWAELEPELRELSPLATWSQFLDHLMTVDRPGRFANHWAELLEQVREQLVPALADSFASPSDFGVTGVKRRSGGAELEIQVPRGGQSTQLRVRLEGRGERPDLVLVVFPSYKFRVPTRIRKALRSSPFVHHDRNFYLRETQGSIAADPIVERVREVVDDLVERGVLEP